MALVVAVALVDSLTHPTRLLAAQRSYPQSLEGMWELPGGKVEEGETPEHGVVRELQEELSITPTLGQLVPGPEGDWPIGKHTMRVWLATSNTEPVRGADHSKLRWCNADSLLNLDWLPGDVALAHQLSAWMKSPELIPPIPAR
ncbi:(deoxy)nucleoside triphosphate pyrophosphohydrolase [Flaviflexus massiliensis]|uniref:(deoxy)nucleoside triphosphate pyrophosphohydrolase n=1 Tax=Flaviflexus massiliensis TaxID=1522309 RepID=UPI0006D53C12|nr:(deoxy)nucleoside triphosphate pyrophosphohydrolase [Flaviflexus massiliensis]